MPFPAKFSGRCDVCGRSFPKDAMIEKSTSTSSKFLSNYRHAECKQLTPHWWDEFVKSCEVLAANKVRLAEVWLSVAKRYLGDNTEYKTTAIDGAVRHTIARVFGDTNAPYPRSVSLRIEIEPKVRDYSRDRVDGVVRSMMTVTLLDATAGKSATWGAAGTSVKVFGKKQWRYYFDE